MEDDRSLAIVVAIIAVFRRICISKREYVLSMSLVPSCNIPAASRCRARISQAEHTPSEGSPKIDSLAKLALTMLVWPQKAAC